MLAACLAFGALAAVWSVVAPLGESPDEPAHLALVLHLADGSGYPSYDGLRSPRATDRLCTTYAAVTRACPRPGEVVTATSFRRHPADDAPDKATRPAWDDAGGAVRGRRANQMAQHPPLYYQSMAMVLRAERWLGGGPWSADRELALLRLANAMLLVPLPGLAWWAARRAGLDDTVALTAALVPFAIPMVTHIGAALNNDNLLTLAGALLVALLAGVARGDRSLRTAVAVGLVAGVALLTKASAVVFPPVIALAYLLAARRGAIPSGHRVGPTGGSGWRRALGPLGLAGAVTAVVAGWWYVGVRLRTGQFAPTTEDDRLTEALRSPGFEASTGRFLGEFARTMDQRFWGSFGWYTVRLSTGLTYAVTAVAAALVAAAFVGPRRTTEPADASVGPTMGEPAVDRITLGLLLLPFAALAVFVAQHAWVLYARTSRFPFMQGRYLFAGIVGVGVVMAAGLVRLVGRWAPLLALGAAAGLQGWSLYRGASSWWGGTGIGPRGQVRALVSWSAWPGEALVLLAVLAAAGGLALVLLVGRTLASPAGTGPRQGVAGPADTLEPAGPAAVTEPDRAQVGR